MTDKKQKRALLLYQAGQATQDIFDTLAETGDDDGYNSAVASLDTYFSPKKHVDYEIFKFRDAKQQAHETIDQFATRFRKLAATCDFASIDKEVKSAIIQNCSSKRLRRYALLDNEVTLAKLLAKGRGFELSESRKQLALKNLLKQQVFLMRSLKLLALATGFLLRNRHQIHVKIQARNHNVEIVEVPGPIATIFAQQKENRV